MAYSRYGRESNWYIFWLSPHGATKDDERVAVWHADHRKDQPDFSYGEIRQMMAVDDFSQIPGFSQQDVEFVRGALSEFVADVDDEYEKRAV